MKPTIKIDRQTGETKVNTYTGLESHSWKETIVVFEPVGNSQSGYIIFPEGVAGVPDHMKNVLIEWKKV